MPPTPTPTPSADPSLLSIQDGIQLAISIIALALSAAALWFTLSARPKVRAYVRTFNATLTNGSTHFDGYELVLVNFGRSSAVITGAHAITQTDERRTVQQSSRGPSNNVFTNPDTPATLAPQGVITFWFSGALAGQQAGLDKGFEIEHAKAPLLSKELKLKTFIVKAEPPITT